MTTRLITAAVASALGLATAFAQAQTSPFDLYDGAGGTLAVGQTSLDWSADGSGVAIGLGPFGTPLIPGTEFQFLYQANLVNVNPGGVAGFPATLDTSANGVWAPNGYEFTVAASLYELVSSYDVIPGAGTPLSPTLGFATFVRDPSKVSKISIFYDSAAGGGANANTATGTGFVDGQEILRMTITDGNGLTGADAFSTFSSFTAFDVGQGFNQGVGSTSIYAELIEGTDDFVNPAFLYGVSKFIFDMQYQSNLNFPAASSTTTTFHAGTDASGGLYPSYAVAVGDILFKVDGDNSFAVPAPGALSLLGIGLAALGFWRRRREV